MFRNFSKSNFISCIWKDWWNIPEKQHSPDRWPSSPFRNMASWDCVIIFLLMAYEFFEFIFLITWWKFYSCCRSFVNTPAIFQFTLYICQINMFSCFFAKYELALPHFPHHLTCMSSFNAEKSGGRRSSAEESEEDMNLALQLHTTFAEPKSEAMRRVDEIIRAKEHASQNREMGLFSRFFSWVWKWMKMQWEIDDGTRWIENELGLKAWNSTSFKMP